MVRRVPDHFALFQRADHAFEILTIDHVFVGAQASPGLQPVDNRVIVWAIDANARFIDTEHARAHLQRQEMNANQ